MKDLNCPYCGAELEVCHDDGFGYEEGVKHEMQCSECSKYFVFETCISFSYDSEKADCLNDGEHVWKASQTWPKKHTRMICESCGEERTPTESEMSEIMREYYENS